MNIKQRILKFVKLLMLIVAITSTAIYFYSKYKERKAIYLAQEYLSSKYMQEMQYRDITFLWLYDVGYRVSFNPVNNLDLIFFVNISADTGNSQNESYVRDGFAISDTYLSDTYSFYTNKVVEGMADTIWKNSKTYVIAFSDRSRNEKPHELMTVEEMEFYFNYKFHITTNRLLNNQSKNEEAYRVLMMIQQVQASRYQPEEILFYYLTGKDASKENVRDIETSPERMISFDNWMEITTIEQVIAEIDKQ